MTNFPTLSLAALESGDDRARQALAAAAADWGFFRLVDHGIQASRQAQFLAAAVAFFALPSAEKLRCSRSEDNPWGYFDRELTKNRQDWKEIFDLGRETQDGEQNSTPWPDQPDGFTEVMLDWHAACEAISLKLIRALCEAMGFPADSLESHFKPDNSSFLRLNHYPVCATPADAAEDFPETGNLGIYHHTDAGAVTVLLQDGISGLQVMHGGKWVSLPADKESLIINIGDLIQVWSNDRFKAPLHRVLANASSERYSAAFFMNPTFATDCVPLGTESPRYRSVNWGEFRGARAAGDYADLGEETQITDYWLPGVT
ncbi:MAG: 2OG-Fe(II) oxygenase family protein [Gammaproteobacteria bacterium]